MTSDSDSDHASARNLPSKIISNAKQLYRNPKQQAKESTSTLVEERFESSEL